MLWIMEPLHQQEHAVDFGNLTDGREAVGNAANSSSWNIYGGGSPSQNTIEFITISSTGDAQDFGDLQAGNYNYKDAQILPGVFFGGMDHPNATDWNL